jgi:hypothetical protein
MKCIKLAQKTLGANISAFQCLKGEGCRRDPNFMHNRNGARHGSIMLFIIHKKFQFFKWIKLVRFESSKTCGNHGNHVILTKMLTDCKSVTLRHHKWRHCCPRTGGTACNYNLSMFHNLKIIFFTYSITYLLRKFLNIRTI